MTTRLPDWIEKNRVASINNEIFLYHSEMNNKYPKDIWDYKKECMEKSKKMHALSFLKRLAAFIAGTLVIIINTNGFSSGVLTSLLICIYIYVEYHVKSNEPDWVRMIDPRNDEEIKAELDIDMRIRNPDIDRELWISKNNYTNNYLDSEISNENIDKTGDLFTVNQKDRDILLSDTCVLAEQGDANKQFELGSMYHERRGVGDNEKAVHWYLESAEQGCVEAQYTLGQVYGMGVITPVDLNKSVFWFRKAASHNHSNAQFVLGCRYADGEGVKQNIDEAIFWYQQAAEQNSGKAFVALAEIYSNELSVVHDDKKAFFWYQKAAEKDLASAQFELAVIYSNGKGVPPDKERASYWYGRAAQNGSYKAKQLLNSQIS